MMFMIRFVDVLAQLLSLAILVRVLLSWLPIDRNSRLVAIILQITEPIIAPIRNVLPSFGGLDFSPMVALLLLEMVRSVVLQLLQRLMM